MPGLSCEGIVISVSPGYADPADTVYDLLSAVKSG
jgi:hypothetical protein